MQWSILWFTNVTPLSASKNTWFVKGHQHNFELRVVENTLQQQAFKNYCKSVGIHQELTVPGTPQQNGMVEKFNRVSVEMTRCLLLEGKLGKQFWVSAMATALYLRNRCPTSRNDGR